jgi:GMP synthase-like glutamine amidotransferase
LKIGILTTGAPPPELIAPFGDYPAMFRRLLGDAYAYADFDVAAGALPAVPQDCDAYVITGSAASAYDDVDWVHRLKDFLRSAKGEVPLVGICFGHQVMAEAFGGRVEKSPSGWGIGLHVYDVRERRLWMDGASQIRVPASHQDQVVEAPGAAVLAANAFCPLGMLDWGQAAISLQLHPEFDPAYAQALIETRRSRRIPEEAAQAAIDSLEGPDDRARVAGWIRRFLEGAA